MTETQEDPSENQRQASLFEHASKGDGSALDGLIACYLPRLRGYVRVHMGEDLRRRESADDVVQSVCRELAEQESCLRFDDEQRFRGWLFKAALNKVREKGRFHRREKRDLGREELADARESGDRLLAAAYASAYSPSQQAMAREQVERFEIVLDSLSEDHREVIALARIARLPHAIVAEQMGRSVSAIRKLLGRALLELNRRLEERPA